MGTLLAMLIGAGLASAALIVYDQLFRDLGGGIFAGYSERSIELIADGLEQVGVDKRLYKPPAGATVLFRGIFRRGHIFNVTRNLELEPGVMLDDVASGVQYPTRTPAESASDFRNFLRARELDARIYHNFDSDVAEGKMSGVLVFDGMKSCFFVFRRHKTKMGDSPGAPPRWYSPNKAL